MFQNVDAYAGDPILSLMEAFQQDPRADKVNLSIGLYYNEQAIIPQLEAVRQAADRLQSQLQKASLYLPMEGLAPYRRAVQTLLFGEHHPALRAGRIATIQTLGGSGALKVGADFLKRYFPDSAVWVSDPTWENHVAIFAGRASRCIPIPGSTGPPAGSISPPCLPPSSSSRRAASCCSILAAIIRRGPISPRAVGSGD